MPLIFAIPAIIGGYALFVGALANKVDPSPAPTESGGVDLTKLAGYAIAGGLLYYFGKKVIK